MANKSKLTPRIRNILTTSIGEHGLTIGTACKAAGISRSVFYKWLEQGKAEEKGPYRKLVDAIATAKAQFEEKRLQEVTDAAINGEVTTIEEVKVLSDGLQVKRLVKTTRHDWRISAWLLARIVPERYSERAITDGRLRVKGGEPANGHQVTFTFRRTDSIHGSGGDAKETEETERAALPAHASVQAAACVAGGPQESLGPPCR